MEHRDVLTLPAIGCTLALAAIVACTPKGIDATSAAKTGVEIGAAQADRIDAMGFPGALAPDPSNRFCDDPSAAQLGQLLFFDAGLSSNGQVSCATCHQPERAFTDGLALNEGLSRGVHNTLTILDAAHQQWFNWDGKFDSLWSQAHGPMTHPREMGATLASIADRIRGTAALRSRYETLFGAIAQGKLTHEECEAIMANIGKAIAAYERKLVTGPSPVDRWIERWRQAGRPRDADSVPLDDLPPDALQGLDTFTSRGNCWLCHVGPLLSDGEFHALGAAPRDNLISDAGRFEAVGSLRSSPFRASGAYSDDPSGEQAKIVESLIPQPDQWGAFRTPTLRNVALTAPYFHMGQFDSLDGVIDFYSTLDGAVTIDHHRESVLKRRDFSPSEKQALVAFLRALSGTPPPVEWTRNPWEGDNPAH